MAQHNLRRAVRLALATSAAASALYGATANAQDQDQPTTDDTIGTVTVTGSRIPQPNLTSISPVTSVSAETIKIEGVTRVEDLINNLPQAFADFGGNLSNGATGAATVNLRALGAQRTLVLVNGRRLMPGDPTQNGNATADLNQIPASLIERIEVLTGGASAVYGADAVAGVVNFIMNDSFEGVRLDAQYGFYQHEQGNDEVQGLIRARNFGLPESNVRDGYSKDITFVMGLNTADGRGNATVYAGYRELDALLQSERDFSACSLNATSSGTARVCGGSGTTSPTRLQAIVNVDDPATPQDDRGGDVGSFIANPDGSLRAYNGTLDAFNFAPTNFYQRPDERYTAGLFAHYDVGANTQAYTEFSFMDDQTLAQIAPSGLFFGAGPGFGGGYLVNCDNPFMSAAQVQTFCTDQGLAATDVASIGIGKRNVEGGGRISDLQHTSYRAVVGLRGSFTDAWGYDVYGLYGTTEFSQAFLNDFSGRRARNALIAVNDPMNPGQVICGVNADADTTNDDAACVPYNIFGLDQVTPEALAYVQTPGFQTGFTKETVVSGAITGDLGAHGLKLPTASDGVGIAFGAEYRREEQELRNDVAFSTGDLLGQGGATLDSGGAYDVQEVFTEIRIPLVQDKPFAQSVSMEGGYRYSDYSLGFTTDTYKFGMDWAPVEDIRFRGSFQRAVRAPNVQELFRPQVVQLDGNTDPCAGDLNPATDTPAPTRSAAACALTGVAAGQYGTILPNSANQYNGLTGGNPVLDPESSDTTSFGFVFTPTFLDNFSLAVDYFDISVEQVVGTIGADLILNSCMDLADPRFCDLVNRAPGSGSLWLGVQGFVTDTTFNLGSLSTKGVDMEANYRLDIGGAGRLSFQLIGTYLDELLNEPLPGFATYDCVGLYGTVCLTPSPEWRHKFRTTWSSPWALDLSLTWRHIESVDIDSTVDNPNFDFQGHPAVDETLDSMNYLDLAASYGIDSEMAKLTLRLGINNLTDEDPPILTSASCMPVFCNGNTLPQVYDTLGRTVFLSMTADF